MSLNTPAGEPRSLYAYQTTEQARYLTGNDTAEINGSGGLFLAIDTLARKSPIRARPSPNWTRPAWWSPSRTTSPTCCWIWTVPIGPNDGFRNREINGIPLLNVSLKNAPGSLLPLSVETQGGAITP